MFVFCIQDKSINKKFFKARHLLIKQKFKLILTKLLLLIFNKHVNYAIEKLFFIVIRSLKLNFLLFLIPVTFFKNYN